MCFGMVCAYSSISRWLPVAPDASRALNNCCGCSGKCDDTFKHSDGGEVIESVEAGCVLAWRVPVPRFASENAA